MKLHFIKRVLSSGWLVSIDDGALLQVEVTGRDSWTIEKPVESGPSVSGIFDDPRIEPMAYYQNEINIGKVNLMEAKAINKHLTGIIQQAMQSPEN